MRTGMRPTARGWGIGLIGLALAVGGVLAGSPALLIVGVGALIGVLADAALLALAGPHRVGRLQRAVTPSPVHAEAVATVQLALRPSGRLDWGHLPVEVDDAIPARAGRVALDTTPAYTVVPSRRGLWTIGPGRVRARSPLGAWRWLVAVAAPTNLLAWPAIAPLGQDHPLARRPDDLLPGRGGPRAAQIDDMTLRDYRPGDDLRRIHWASSARTGTLLTRTEEPVETRRAWLGLWLGPDVTDEAGELAIALAASCAVVWHREGFAVDVWHGTDRLGNHLEDQLEALALLDPADCPGGLAGLPPPAGLDGPAVLLVAPGTLDRSRAPWDDLPAAVPETLRRALRRASRVGVLVGAEDAGRDRLQAAGWTSLVVDPATPLATAAARLGQVLADPATADNPLRFGPPPGPMTGAGGRPGAATLLAPARHRRTPARRP